MHKLICPWRALAEGEDPLSIHALAPQRFRGPNDQCDTELSRKAAPAATVATVFTADPPDPGKRSFSRSTMIRRAVSVLPAAISNRRAYRDRWRAEGHYKSWKARCARSPSLRGRLVAAPDTATNSSWVGKKSNPAIQDASKMLGEMLGVLMHLYAAWCGSMRFD